MHSFDLCRIYVNSPDLGKFAKSKPCPRTAQTGTRVVSKVAKTSAWGPQARLSKLSGKPKPRRRSVATGGDGSQGWGASNHLQMVTQRETPNSMFWVCVLVAFGRILR